MCFYVPSKVNSRVTVDISKLTIIHQADVMPVVIAI